jgi:glucan phosphoethanolaminetransferase (alkaline phosphatase superfamily)
MINAAIRRRQDSYRFARSCAASRSNLAVVTWTTEFATEILHLEGLLSSNDPIVTKNFDNALSARGVLWCTRNVLFGAALGAALSFLGQAAIMGFGGAPSGGIAPGLGVRLGGVFLTAAGYAAVLLVTSVMTAPTMRWALGRAVSVTLTTLITTGLVALHVVGVAVRIVSGAFLTRGALEFFFNGQESMLRALRTTYIAHVTVVALIGIAIAALHATYLFRGLRREGNVPKAARLLGAATALVLLHGAAVLVLPARTAMAMGLSRTTPEMALLSSLHTIPAWTEEVSPDEQGATPARQVQEGPPRFLGTQWDEAVSADKTKHPNVLLVVIDSLTTRRMGYMGYSRPVTPNIDRLAAKSMRLLRAWATATHSNYAQPAIISSLFPRRIPWLDQYARLDYPRVLLHDVFHRAGHSLATISSQDQNWQGIARFEETTAPVHLWHAADYDGPRVDIVSEKVVPDEVTADRAITWMKEHHDKPFSLYVNFQIAHFPYGLPDGVPPKYTPAHYPHTANFVRYGDSERTVLSNRYDNAIDYVDAQVGKLVAHLEQSGLSENTILVITADHGEMMGEHGVVTHGKSLYEGEARIPLLVHYPSKISPADVLTPVSHLDVLPTISELAGIPQHPAFQGHSFANPAAHAAKRTGIFLNTQGYQMTEGVICYPWKLWIDRTEGNIVRLVHLDDDPEENHNLATDKPTVARALSKMLGAQFRAQIDYHASHNQAMRDTRFAPRLLSCPELPAR